jgi:(p)ppGpp synthase/HD superfamily hydrolase
MNTVQQARAFAIESHDRIGQKRKYSGEPYWTHCEDVALMVKSVGGDDNMIAAAYLHDTVEDTGVTLTTIEEKFGADVASLVEQLTDVSKPTDGKRAIRKAIDREHTSQASSRAKTIKLADLISNSKSIVEHDLAFARVYLMEKELLLPLLAEGNAQLWKQAKDILDAAIISLK